MGASERRERERADLRQRILDAGRAILVDEGYQALTMRKLADKVEYTPGALYAHFPDKDALVRAICQVDMQAFARECHVALQRPDPIDQLRELARIYARFALEHPQQYKVLFVLDPVPAISHDELLDRGNPESDAYAVLELAVTAAIEAGHLPGMRARPQLVAQLLWAAIHGVVSIEIRRHEGLQIPFEPIEDRVEAMCDTMLAGLTVVNATSPRAAKASGARPRKDAAKVHAKGRGAGARRTPR